MNSSVRFFREAFRKSGFDFCRFRRDFNPECRRRYILDKLALNHVIDVGANEGQYAMSLRQDGYRGEITSLEPLPGAYEKLVAKTSSDIFWGAKNVACGAESGKAWLNVAKNSQSSSFLPMGKEHLKAAPQSEYEDRIEVEVRPVVDFIDLTESRKTMIKMDVQGHEFEVLKGAIPGLESIAAMYVELSLTELYPGEKLFHEFAAEVKRLGYTPVAIDPGFSNPLTGRLLQADFFFVSDAVIANLQL